MLNRERCSLAIDALLIFTFVSIVQREDSQANLTLSVTSDVCNLVLDLKFHYVLTTSHLSTKVTAPQDAHGRLVLQVYLGSDTSEFSAIHR